jgi:hypothetical protein
MQKIGGELGIHIKNKKLIYGNQSGFLSSVKEVRRAG